MADQTEYKKEYKNIYMKKYRQTENGIKTGRFCNWRKAGLVGSKEEYNIIYERYVNTTNCELCDVLLGGRAAQRKCMEHSHITGKFRNICCVACNCGKSDRKVPTNNTSGYKNIIRDKDQNRWIYEKRICGKLIKRTRVNKIDILCIKFAAIILYRN